MPSRGHRRCQDPPRHRFRQSIFQNRNFGPVDFALVNTTPANRAIWTITRTIVGLGLRLHQTNENRQTPTPAADPRPYVGATTACTPVSGDFQPSPVSRLLTRSAPLLPSPLPSASTSSCRAAAARVQRVRARKSPTSQRGCEAQNHCMRSANIGEQGLRVPAAGNSMTLCLSSELHSSR